ncbi:tRNA1(Val) (adenine(37)-N6)-methyltransferase [Maricaulis sp. CAU 1757]
MTTTEDRLLGGSVLLRQSKDGYRAGMDAVLLAAALDARPAEHVVEFGCGPGAVMLCAARRLPGTRFTGVERDVDAAALARDNVALNACADRVSVLDADIGDLPPMLRADQVVFNPPFFDDPSRLRPPRPEKQAAWLAGDAPLAVWVRAAARVLPGRGRLTMIHRADKLDDILSALRRSFGSVVIKPVAPRAGTPAKRVLVTARIGGRGPLQLLAPLLLHDGDSHSAEAQALLRGERPLSWKD